MPEKQTEAERLYEADTASIITSLQRMERILAAEGRGDKYLVENLVLLLHEAAGRLQELSMIADEHPLETV